MGIYFLDPPRGLGNKLWGLYLGSKKQVAA